jgi:hypothetical protein
MMCQDIETDVADIIGKLDGHLERFAFGGFRWDRGQLSQHPAPRGGGDQVTVSQ